MSLLILLKEFFLIGKLWLIFRCRLFILISIHILFIIAHALIINLLNKLILQRLIIQINRCQYLLDFIVVRFVCVDVKFCQYVLLFCFLKHLKDRVDELEGGDALAWELLICTLLLPVGDVACYGGWLQVVYESVYLLVVVEVYSCEVLLYFKLPFLGVVTQHIPQTSNYFLSLLLAQH